MAMQGNFLEGFFSTMVGALRVSSPPLYRYPYRNSIEAFRSDWKHIGTDIEAAQQRYDGTAGGGEI